MHASLMRRLFKCVAVTASAGVVAAGLVSAATPASAADGYQQVSSFGSNPGSLNMFSYLPTGMPAAGAPLVVALHGCTQSAGDYHSHSGWSKYAELYKFAVVYAEQPNGSGLTKACFDWGTKANDSRGNGQALSIYQMVQYAEVNYHVDPSRIYLTGLSAGGGMTSDLLADYPDVFAAGSVDSGPPAQCTTAGITDSSCTSNNTNNKTPAQWGDLVRNSYPGYSGPWPRVQIWQGASDPLVAPVALTESRDQWTNVWGISQTPSGTATLTGGTTENIYNDSTGKPAVETFSISGMGHGLAVHPGSATDQCGTTGTYYLDSICSSYYSAKFFGLDVTGLPAPDGLAVTGTTDTSASLSWNSVSGAVGYNVYRDGAKVNTSAVTATTYTDTGLTANTTYSYTVTAVDSTGAESAPSATVSGTTAAQAQCFTDNNYNQTVAGRAHQVLGYVYANGSDQAMGLWNVFTVHTLQQTAPNYYIIADGRC